MRTQFEPRPQAETAGAQRRQSLPIRHSAAGGLEASTGMKNAVRAESRACGTRRPERSAGNPSPSVFSLGILTLGFEPLDRSSIARPIPPHQPLCRRQLEAPTGMRAQFEPRPQAETAGAQRRQSLPIRHFSGGMRAPRSGTDRPQVGSAGVEAEVRNQHSQFEPLDRSSIARPIPPHPPFRRALRVSRRTSCAGPPDGKQKSSRCRGGRATGER